MSEQLQIFPPDLTEAHVDELVRVLRIYGWSTRRQLKERKGWCPRFVRGIAEAAGDRVVRGPRGYNTFEQSSLDEIEHCAAIADRQGTKMKNYALALRMRAHQRIG